MTLFFRKIRIFGRFPFVRLLQIIDNPSYVLHLLKKNFIYKRSGLDYAAKYESLTFLTGQETLESLINTGSSLARFSDGEFEQITGGGIYPPDSDWCQKWSNHLKVDIIKSLSSTDDRLLVAVDPPSTFLASKDSSHDIRFEYNMWVDMRRLMWRYLSLNKRYGHSHLFIKANCPDLRWDDMRNFFSEKNIIIATGNVHALSHLELGNRTYFIECGTENAYERRHLIMDSIRRLIAAEQLDKSSLIVLASLGPTAGIIALAFLDEDICVWDTGHMFEFAAESFIENVLSKKRAG